MRLDISGIKGKLKNTYIRLTYRRKCRLYLAGYGKSGTTSITDLFNHRVVTRRSCMRKELLNALLDLNKGRIQKSDVRALILKRDREYYADVDTSPINSCFVDILLEEFPDALFLLTMRDPYSWMDSAFNLRVNASVGNTTILRHQLLGLSTNVNTSEHPPEERSLESMGVPTLNSMLAYWNQRNQAVISTVPEHRLLIVKTMDITKRAYEIAGFAGLPRSTIRLSRSGSQSSA